MDRQAYQMKIKREIFSFASNMKILIYGTGKIAKLLIENLYDFNIVGVIDAHKVEGELQGIPVIMWDDVDKDTADILIIAARNDVQREIFHRIKHYSVMYDFRIYNVLGHEFTSKEYFKEYEVAEISSVNNTYDNLIEQIDAHDVISFDLYDTLIMRKVLEPIDVFDIVGGRIKEYGINVKDFKKNRCAAELEADGRNIYEIYDILKKRLFVDDEQAKAILNEEIKCEKECTILRDEMVKAYNYAKKIGKRVVIISNMYLTSEIIEDILSSLGITDYDRLLISCEHGCYKSNGLYDVHLKEFSGRCLHIGDNSYEDVLAAEKAGLDTFHINSALEMLKISKMSELMNYAHGISNRAVIGLIIAELFNSPFALAGYYGYVPVSLIDRFVSSFIAPIVIGYMQNLIEYVKEHEFDGVIFPSRDGYIFNELYEYMKDNSEAYGAGKNKPLPDCYYLLTSRKTACSVAVFNEKDMEDVELRLDCTDNRKAFWIGLMGFQSDAASDIIKESALKRKGYIAYMRRLGISHEKKYLFCDFISRGTSQIALNRLFYNGLKGYYLCRLTECCDLGTSVDCLCDGTRRNNLSRYTDFLEAFITAPAPSVDSVDSKGEILYKKENRSSGEINILLENQSAITKSFKAYMELINMIKNIYPIDGELLETLTGLIGAVIPLGEVKDFFASENVDSVLEDKFNIMRRIYH